MSKYFKCLGRVADPGPRVDWGGSGLPMFTADKRGIGDESPLSELFAFLYNPIAGLVYFNEHVVSLEGDIPPIQLM